MTAKICVIWDSKAEAYLPPMFFQSLGQAERSFGDICNDKTHPIGQHPSHYTLMCIGEWDELEGTMKMLELKISVAEGQQMVTREALENG